MPIITARSVSLRLSGSAAEPTGSVQTTPQVARADDKCSHGCSAIPSRNQTAITDEARNRKRVGFRFVSMECRRPLLSLRACLSELGFDTFPGLIRVGPSAWARRRLPPFTANDGRANKEGTSGKEQGIALCPFFGCFFLGKGNNCFLGWGAGASPGGGRTQSGQRGATDQQPPTQPVYHYPTHVRLVSKCDYSL